MGLKRAERIKSKSDFQRIRKSGFFVKGKNIEVCICRNALHYNRLGVKIRNFKTNGAQTLGDKAHPFAAKKQRLTACKRNRVKRILRESYRLNCELVEKGFDIIIFYNGRPVKILKDEIEKEMISLLARAIGIK